MASNIKVDSITNQAGTGAPDFPQGITVAGTTINTTIEGGSYTPTFANLIGLSAVNSTGEPLRWFRFGDIVFVSGGLLLTGTSSTNSPSFEMSLPVALTTNFVSNLDGRCSGVAVSRVGDWVKGQVLSGNTDNTKALVESQFGSNLGGSPDITINFSYSITDLGS